MEDAEKESEEADKALEDAKRLQEEAEEKVRDADNDEDKERAQLEADIAAAETKLR